jgi:DNA invertase Pin-like site-specific DNA recombinase
MNPRVPKSERTDLRRTESEWDKLVSRARSMLADGVSTAEVSRRLGVSGSTLRSRMNKKG